MKVLGFCKRSNHQGCNRCYVVNVFHKKGLTVLKSIFLSHLQLSPNFLYEFQRGVLFVQPFLLSMPALSLNHYYTYSPKTSFLFRLFCFFQP